MPTVKTDLLVADFDTPANSRVMLNAATGSIAGPVFSIDQPFPHVVSITPGGPILGGSAQFSVTFSQSVSGVDASDFRAITAGGSSAGAISVSQLNDQDYTVTINDVTGVGTLGLNLIDDGSIRDALGNPLAQSVVSQIFSAGHTVTVPVASSRIVAGDFNGDGKTDLFSRNITEVFVGNGDGTFHAGWTDPFSYHGPMTVADLNSDGLPDVLLSFPMTTLLSNGDGSFRITQGFNEQFSRRRSPT